MGAHSVAAFVALLFLVLAAILCIVGTGTLHWLGAEVEIEQAMPMLNMFVPSGGKNITLKLEIDAYFGLRKTCTDVEVDFKHAPDQLRQAMGAATGMTLPMETTLCLTKEGIPKGPRRDQLLHAMRHFRRIFISMVVGLILLCCTIIVALVKSPCVRIKVKKSLLVVTLLLAVASVIPFLAGVVIARNELRGDADFVKIGLANNMEKFPLVPGMPGSRQPPASVATTTTAAATTAKVVSTTASSASTAAPTNRSAIVNTTAGLNTTTTQLNTTVNSTLSPGTTQPKRLRRDVVQPTEGANGTSSPNATQPKTVVNITTANSTVQPTTGGVSTTTYIAKTNATSIANASIEPDEHGADLSAFLMKEILKQVEDSMKKGYSYNLICSGIVFIFLAILLTVLEYYFAKKSGEGEYERELLKSDGYDMPSKAKPESA